MLMVGMNPQLDGEAPIVLIHKGESQRVIDAAPNFLTGQPLSE